MKTSGGTMLVKSKTSQLKHAYFFLSTLFLFSISFLISCASVPKEVVELSYRVGQDLSELQQSYDKLIHEFFEQLRFQRLTYLEETWIPIFLNDWVVDGKLVEIAKGELVWSEENEAFVAPHSTDAKTQLLQSIHTWAGEAIFQIENKRKHLLSPLYLEEDSLRTLVAESFDQLIRGNATITAHLNSIREVQEIQDKALQAIGIKELRNNINSTLATASERAAESLRKIKAADAELYEQLRKVKGKMGTGD